MKQTIEHPILALLRQISPDLAINTNSQDIALACTDWRKRYHGTALAVLSPHTLEQVQAIVKICDENRIAISTQGGNTGLAGGAVPCTNLKADKAHIVLKTSKLRNHLSVDVQNLTITASAGYALQEIQEAADKAGFLFPLSLASEGSCTIGGNLASNAGGVAVLRYGNARELCLGLEFVTAQGELYSEMRGLRKNNTGYDLRHLLIGSEGTLGVITQACLKVYPKPKSKVVTWLHVSNIDSAVRILNAIQTQLLNELSSYEWMNPYAIELVEKHFTVKAPKTDVEHCDHVLAEFSGACTDYELRVRVEQCFTELLQNNDKEQLGLLNVVVSQNLSDNQALWAVRENISEAQAKEGLNVKHDVACAVSSLPTFYHNALAQIEQLGLNVRPVLFGHLGDGNLHFNISGPANSTANNFLNKHQASLNHIVHTAIVSAGGTISAEHGIGQFKTQLLKDITPTTHYDLFKAIKHALDPNNTLNPGKILLA